MINVLIVYAPGFEFTDDQVKTLKAEYPQCAFEISDNDSVTDAQLEKAEVLVGFPNPAVLKKAKHLKWLHLSSIGVDKHVDQSLYASPDVMLSNSSGTYGHPISEHIVGLMVALARNFKFFMLNQPKALWEKKMANKDMFGSTVLIVGLGDVGSQVAQRLQGFGMHIIGVKRTMGPKPAYVDELYTSADLNTLLPKADFVVLSLAATPDTVHIMSKERLALMRKDAYLINIGRGTLIDQNALYEALKTKQIAGAAIDVSTPEPLPEDNPLWGLDNLIITPHCSGKSPTTSLRQFAIFKEELGRYVEGQKPKNLIDFKLKY